jgi:hypothetical protein
MEGKYNEIELTWIRKKLVEHGEFLSDLFRKEIEAKRLYQDDKTRVLQQSVGLSVTSSGNSPMLEMNFVDHGRLVEIQYHTSKNTKTRRNITVNRIIIGEREKPKKRKKDTRWYAKTAYGTLNRLIGIIGYELSDEERKRIKANLESGNI